LKFFLDDDMVKVLIINPEFSACAMLTDHFDIAVNKTFEVNKVYCLEEAEEVLYYFKPDFIFLDLDMSLKDISNFLLYGQHSSASIIFTGQYNPYFEKAIRFCSLHYLPNHLHADSVGNVIQKCLDRPITTSQKMQLYQVLIGNLQAKSVKNFQLAIVSDKRVCCFSPNDIVRFQADQEEVVVHLKNSSIITTGYTLWHFETILQPLRFIRCHKIHLVNPVCITGITHDNYVSVSDGSCLEIYRRMAGEVLKHLNRARKIVLCTQSAMFPFEILSN